jgi:Spy/CpxP family protein refolding chaperone
MNLRILIPFAVAGVVLAQGPNRPPNQQPNRPPAPGGPGMPVQPPDFGALKSYLNLTDVQIQKMQQAREQAGKEADEKVKTIQPQIRDKRIALEDLMEKGTNDPATVGKMMLEIHALQKQARQAQEAVRASELNVLTAEQKTRFKAIEDAATLPAATRDAARLGLVPRPQGEPQPSMMRPGAGVPGQGGGMMGPRPGMMGPRQGMPGQGGGMMGPGPQPRGQDPGPDPAPCPCQGGR